MASTAKSESGPTVAGQGSVSNVSQDEVVGVGNETASGEGKVVVPTFEEFLEYILSTDLQGKGLTGAKTYEQLTHCLLTLLTDIVSSIFHPG